MFGQTLVQMSKFYNLSALSAEGENLSFSSLEGYVLLIVNTASKCGFSKQYSGLQKLYEKYEGNKFKILAFPCNQFGSQEPGNQDEILKYCVKNHGVTFPIMDKIFVKGRKQHPLFNFLVNEKPGFLIRDIKWNFTKFLIDRQGKVIKRYSPTADPRSLESDIERQL